MALSISPARIGMSWRGVLLRGLLPCLVFLIGYTALANGVHVSERRIPATPLHFVYYALGLFVLGGLDLGTPVDGPDWARRLLWFSFFAAPLVTASAVVEALWVLALPVAYRLRRLRDHTVVVGGSRLAELYLQRLRAYSPQAPVIMVDRNPGNPRLQTLAAKYPLTLITGDINSDVTLALLRLRHARRVLLLTGNDFTNLNAASHILELAPALAGRVVLHLGNLALLRTLNLTGAVKQSAFFNSHEIAARQLVRDHLLARFERTLRSDFVVLAGFGRFGQCVLAALQDQAQGRFEQVLILDLAASARVSAYEDRVGFRGGYVHHVRSGSVLDYHAWSVIEHDFELSSREPLIIVGADDDMVNLESALWLRRRYPDAYIVARQFRRSSFSVQIARDMDVVLFAVADLIIDAIPAAWCTRARSSGEPASEATRPGLGHG